MKLLKFHYAKVGNQYKADVTIEIEGKAREYTFSTPKYLSAFANYANMANYANHKWAVGSGTVVMIPDLPDPMTRGAVISYVKNEIGKLIAEELFKNYEAMEKLKK